MKKILFNAAWLATALILWSGINGQEKDHKERPEPKFKKEKSYSKTYALSGSDRVSLSNQFGEMKLSTWDKNEIKVDVTITGKSDDEQRAQQILDKISIVDSKQSGTVSFKTKFADENKDGDNRKDKKEHRNEGMEINYMVYLPAGNPLDLENQFGKTIIPDYRGELALETKFGSLTAGRLTNAKEVQVEFGNAEIAEVRGGKLTIKFSNGTVNKLSGDIESDLEFSKVKLGVDNDAKSLDISNSYSDVYLDLDKNLSATYDITTSHGDFSNKSGFAIQSRSDDDKGYNFSKRYSGTSGSGGLKIRIKSSFGAITAGHNLQVDMTEKSKHKKTKSI
jgi:hypothetical protein